MQTGNTMRSSTRIVVMSGDRRGWGRNAVLHLAGRGVDSIFARNSRQAEVRLVVAASREVGALGFDTGNAGAFTRFATQEATDPCSF